MEDERRRWTEILAEARERLIAGAEIEDTEGPRAEILRSWRRSYDDGAASSSVNDTPYDPNINLDTRLVRAAEPVIGRVHEDILGSPITVVLADSRGKVLLRRSGERTLEEKTDQILLAPGFSYAERYVGTNGIGTALEGRSAAMVQGAEHFNEALQMFACVGVPVRDPITRRQLGVLDITTWADRANPALTALVRQAGSVIEEGLLELSSRGSRTVLDAYLVASRNREDQVLAIGEDAFIGSAESVRRLGGISREDLWLMVAEALGQRDLAELPLLTGNGDAVRLKVRAVRSVTSRLVGAILEYAGEPSPVGVVRVVPAPRRTSVDLAGFSGLSPITMGPAAMVARMAATAMPVCLIGEPGVGKRSMVEAVAARHHVGRILTVVHGDQSDVGDQLDRVREQLAAGHPVLLRAADALPEGGAASLLASLLTTDGGQTHGWLAFSVRSPSPVVSDPPALREMSAAGVPMVAVPPLRARVQDLRQIVPKMLERMSAGRLRSVSPELMTRLLREPWPGNLTEVADVLHGMLSAQGAGTLGVEHLPVGFGSGMRRQLSPMEWLAREAIVEALRSCGGDKTLAAESLGISRASIYRKVKAFGIDVANL